MKVTVEIELGSELLGDIMCTALEGGIGYWCAASHIRRRPDGSYISFKAHDSEEGDEDGFAPETVNYETLAVGIDRMLRPDAKISPSNREALFRGVTRNDSGEIDADCADAVVQFGIFGELVYG